VVADLRRVLLLGLGVIALVALVHPDAMFGGRIYGSADAANYDAFAVAGDQSRHAGDYPEWNPLLFGGMPTFGSLAYRWGVYPPSIVMNWLQNSVGFPPLTWMLLHLVFGGVGVVWFLRRWDLSAAACLAGAAVWILFPRIVAWGVHGHGSKLVAAMYLPWLLGLAFEALDGRGRRAAGWAALLLGLQILRGHIQITYYTLLALGVVFLAGWIVAVARKSAPRPISGTAWGAVAVVVAFLIGAVSLLPVHDYSAWSIRGSSEGGGAAYQYATGWSLSPRELGTFLFPSSAGFGLATYQGSMPFTDYPNTFGFIALSLGLMAALDRRRRSIVITLGVLFLMSVLVSFGNHFPVLFRPFFDWLPYFNKFRIPSMILVLAAMALAMAAGLGLQQLTDPERVSSTRLRAFAIASGVGALFAVIGALGLGQGLLSSQLTALADAAGRPVPSPVLLDRAWDLFRTDLWRLALVAVIAAAGLVAASRSRTWQSKGLGFLILGLLVVELLGVDLRITHPERSLHRVARDASGQTHLITAPTLVQEHRLPSNANVDQGYRRLAENLGHERVWPLGTDSATNDGMISGVRSLGGYHPAKLASFDTIRGRLFDPQRPAARLASWLAAARVTSDRPLPDGALPLLAELGAELDPTPRVFGNLIVYDNRSALPRARLVHDWRRAEQDLNGFLDRVETGEIEPARVVTLDTEPSPLPRPAVSPERPVAYVTDGMDEVVLTAAPSAPAILVLADMWQPGWSVEVNGVAADVLRVDHVLRGVALEAGEHRIRWVYRDPALRRSLVLTLVGVAMALILLVIGARSDRSALVIADESAPARRKP